MEWPVRDRNAQDGCRHERNNAAARIGIVNGKKMAVLGATGQKDAWHLIYMTGP
jgi:hypothetical protein